MISNLLRGGRRDGCRRGSSLRDDPPPAAGGGHRRDPHTGMPEHHHAAVRPSAPTNPSAARRSPCPTATSPGTTSRPTWRAATFPRGSNQDSRLHTIRAACADGGTVGNSALDAAQYTDTTSTTS